MSKLPNHEQAVVPQPKITAYLLDPTHREGGDKAIFFLAFGFSVAQWEVMADALRQHVATHPVVSSRTTPFGMNYAVEGELITPDGRNPQVRTVWKIDTGKAIPSFVTAYPME